MQQQLQKATVASIVVDEARAERDALRAQAIEEAIAEDALVEINIDQDGRKLGRVYLISTFDDQTFWAWSSQLRCFAVVAFGSPLGRQPAEA